ncbi:MAG: UbiX family flavin prenyltransferase [Rikenellaceae bacterium]
MNIVIGITGASGTIYARRLIERIIDLNQEHKIYVVFSEYGEQVAMYECEFDSIKNTPVEFVSNKTMFTTLASGSSEIDAMVVVPCTASTLGRIATATSNNVITRTADVMLKERRKLIIALRETPLTLTHIENMRSCTLSGAVVMPLSPSFYSHPSSIVELVDTQVERIISLLGLSDNSRYVFG